MKLQLLKHHCHKCRRDNRFIPIRDIIILLLHHHFSAVAEDAAVVEEVAEVKDAVAEDMDVIIITTIRTNHHNNSTSSNNNSNSTFNFSYHNSNRTNQIARNIVQHMEHVAITAGNVVILETAINGKQLLQTKWAVQHGIVTPDY